jgi:poly(3-hydroxyalkanoate) synthetase
VTKQTLSQVERWQQAPVDAAIAVWQGWTDYLGNAIRDGSLTPLDVAEDSAEWWRVVTVRCPPSWATPHQELRRWPEARLLDFSLEGSTTTPVLILPPQAGHASTIVDYSATQSQIRTAQASGLSRVLAMEWTAANADTADSSIERYIAILDEAVADLGGRVHLVGDCQGGWLAAVYAALRPDSVASHAVGGAPIDFHAGDSAIQEWVRSLSRSGELDFYRALVRIGGGKHLGTNQINGFKMLEPAEELVRLTGLWGNIRDRRYVQRHIDFTNWFEWGQDIPGAFYLWIVERLFINNELIAKKVVIGGEVVDLAKISAPLFLLAGTQDHITPAAQAFALADHVSTPPEQVRTYLVDAGHLGLFMGHAALSTAWTEVFGRIAELR